MTAFSSASVPWSYAARKQAELVGKVRVERLLGDAGPSRDRADGRRPVPLICHDRRNTVKQPLALRRLNKLARQAAVAARQVGDRGSEDRSRARLSLDRCGCGLHPEIGNDSVDIGYRMVSHSIRGLSMGGRLRRIGVTTLGFAALAATGGAAAQGAELAVNSTADAPDARPADGVCATARAACTLRAAIQEANATAAEDIVQAPARALPPRRARRSLRPARPPTTTPPRATSTPPEHSPSAARAPGRRPWTAVGLDRVFSVGDDGRDQRHDDHRRRLRRAATPTRASVSEAASTTPRPRPWSGCASIGNRADGGGAVFSIPRTRIVIRDSVLTRNVAFEGGAVRDRFRRRDRQLDDHRQRPAPSRGGTTPRSPRRSSPSSSTRSAATAAGSTTAAATT